MTRRPIILTVISVDPLNKISFALYIKYTASHPPNKKMMKKNIIVHYCYTQKIITNEKKKQNYNDDSIRTAIYLNGEKKQQKRKKRNFPTLTIFTWLGVLSFFFFDIVRTRDDEDNN